MEFDHASGESAGRSAEVRVFDSGLIGTKRDGLKVELVEYVVEGAAQFNIRAFAEYPHRG